MAFETYRTIIRKQCERCNREFITIPAEVKRGKGKFCSKECYWSSKTPYSQRLTNIVCIRCKGSFPKPTGRVLTGYYKKYCSRQCRNYGLTEENERLRKSARYKKWRQAIFERDCFTCQTCGQIGRKLSAHHIKSWSKYPDLRFDLKNGQTLCYECHRKTSTWGFRNKLVEAVS